MIDREIKEKKECAGCYACHNICPTNCISMDKDREGFCYPNVNYDKCIKCSKCIKVCPVINRTDVYNEPVAYACMNNDEIIRLNSSSGGIFSLLAERVIEKGGVVFGATFNNKFEVEHAYIESEEELFKLRGSKYVQSKIGKAYKQAKDFLNLSREVLFTGTPCQISGLKAFLGRHYANLTCVDIICHGVPSPNVWNKYINYKEKQFSSQIQKISFRRKNEGWKQYSVSFLFENNTEYLQNYRKDPYMIAFLKNISLRPSCYFCQFKSINRISDITLADFWGIHNILPEMDDDKGTSLVFANSKVGQEALEKIRDKTVCKKVNINEAIKFNPSAVKSVNYNSNRENFFGELNKLSFDRLVNKFCTDSIYVRIKRKAKSIINACNFGKNR